MDKPIYLNYGTTSINKPQSMIDAVSNYLKESSLGSYNLGFDIDHSKNIIYTGREAVAEFFNVKESSNIVFTQNITMSVNMVLNGLLKEGDHVITSPVEHNAVMRPLTLLKEKLGIEVTTLDSSKEGVVEVDNFEEKIQPNTRLIVLNHASNVLGTILPIRDIFKIAKKHDIITILDTAQTAGIIPINMEEYFIDVVTFTGHKSLQALSGIGGFALTDKVAKVMSPWLVGGTGSLSHSLAQPETMPEKFQAGTLNIVGILSLTESIRWISKVGISKIARQELELTGRFLKGLESLPVQILGTKDITNIVPVVSIVADRMSPEELSYQLFERYKIITRSGLHCAPSAHKVAGTFNEGAVRFSFGYTTTEEEIDITLEALKEIL
jgi:cysteine desulfurase family protein